MWWYEYTGKRDDLNIICLDSSGRHHSHVHRSSSHRRRLNAASVPVDDPQQHRHQRGVEDGGAADVEGPAQVLQQLRILLLDGHQEGDESGGTERDYQREDVDLTQWFTDVSCFIKL